jgi:AcrR family transcriptional regulator
VPSDPRSIHPPRRGLRQQKSIESRAEVRAQALRLFRDQGYHQTTTIQIAEAAKVSPATFFRYFATKEHTLLFDDPAEMATAALLQQPCDIDPFLAVSQAVESLLPKLERADEPECRALIETVPELYSAWQDETRKTIECFGTGLARRLDRDDCDFEIRLFVGALASVVLAALDDSEHPLNIELVRRSIGYLKSGFSLTAPGDHDLRQHAGEA